jgi:hypothetical protein
MKRFYSIVLTLGAVCLSFQTAQATLLFSEAFNYTSANLGGNINPSTGNAWSSGSSAMTISTGNNLTYPGLPDQGGNALQVAWGGGAAGSIQTPYANQTSGNIYYSFLLDVTTLPTAQSYLTSLNPGTSTPNGSSDAITMYFGTVTGGGAFKLGVRGGGATAVYTTTTYNANTTYLVVLGYNNIGGAAANNLNLWVDPVLGNNSAPTADLSLTPTTVATAIDNVGFKVQSTPQGAFLIDNLLVGTSWSDVTPGSVPEPAVLAFGVMGLVGGFMLRLRRR